MSVVTDRRVPGVYFLPPPVQRGLGLPPLDVAAFVGFAEKGPVDLPVPVGDLSTYRAIFGGDLTLAYEEGERAVYANLPQSVAAFFTNGGRRCYVVRVVGNGARPTTCRVPKVVALDGSTVRLASITASSPGRWSARFRLATRLDRTPLPMAAFTLEATDAGVRLMWDARGAPAALQVGDLLRLTYGDGTTVLCPVTAIERPTTSGDRLALVTNGVYRHFRAADADPAWVITEATLITTGTQAEGVPIAGIQGDDDAIILRVDTLDDAHVSPGEVLQLRMRLADSTTGTFLFPVATVGKANPDASPPDDQPRLHGHTLLSLDAAPLAASELSGVERLRFDLTLRDGDQRQVPLRDLAFNTGHPAFWGDLALLGSSELSARRETTTASQATVAQPTGLTQSAAAAEMHRLLQSNRRIDPVRHGVPSAAMLAGMLAPVDGTGLTFLPLDMPGVLTEDAFVAPTTADTGDDGLDQFGAASFDWFVDPGLRLLASDRSLRTEALMAEAFDRYYVRDERLRGLHSLLFIDEVALVSLPEAVLRNWQPGSQPPVDVDVPVPEQPVPEPCPPPGPFLDCLRPPSVSEVQPSSGSIRGGTRVTIIGDGFDLGGTTVSFGGSVATDVEVLAVNELHCTTPTAGRAGPVSVEVTTHAGTGSRPNAFRYLPETAQVVLPELERLADYSINLDRSPLLLLQRELIRFCQARADVVAILGLPRHFEKRTCIEWQQELRAFLGLPRRGSVFNDVREIADLSYAAVYHPWLFVRDESSPDAMRAVVPDGAICGMIAARERERQVWVAPANVPLDGALGLTPAISREDWAELFDAQFNLARSEPRDVRAMSAHTLSDEAILLQLSVRRLMILLRKLAYLRGLDFVFEPNHERFREGVRAALNELLRFMFDLGAFAGGTPETSYRVVTDESVNPPQSVDQGRFVALIQVAPSQPAEFITVVLRRAGDQLQLAEA